MDHKPNITSIYNQHVDNLYTYALYLGFEKEVVKDAIHDVFCRLWEERQSLDHVSNVKFYLFRSLKNRLLDIYKAKREFVEINTTLDNTGIIPFDFNITIDDRIAREEDKLQIERQISEMLDSLTERQREVIYLRYIQEYDYPQIAEMLGISVHGCRKLVSKAIISLREKYGSLVMIFLLIGG